ncbi:MAG TPA: hypothetical protein V6C90_00685 [Coleofasciculaceae cyanobacterium]
MKWMVAPPSKKPAQIAWAGVLVVFGFNNNLLNIYDAGVTIILQCCDRKTSTTLKEGR